MNYFVEIGIWHADDAGEDMPTRYLNFGPFGTASAAMKWRDKWEHRYKREWESHPDVAQAYAIVVSLLNHHDVEAVFRHFVAGGNVGITPHG